MLREYFVNSIIIMIHRISKVLMPFLLWMVLLPNSSLHAKEVVDYPIDSLKLKITVGEKILYAAIYESEATRNFMQLLPLELDMQDLNRREKYSPLAVGLSNNGTIKNTYEVGDISFWLGGGLAVFYHQDHAIVKAGLIRIGKLKEGIAAFKSAENLKVRFELVKEEAPNHPQTENRPPVCTE